MLIFKIHQSHSGFTNSQKIAVSVRGEGKGILHVRHQPEGPDIATIEILGSKDWASFCAAVAPEHGKQALYFCYYGEGSLDFEAFTMTN